MKAMQKNSQNARILARLERRKKKGLTAKEAWDMEGVERLGARIWELRHEYGYDIEGAIVEVKNRFGQKCRVTRYFLKDSVEE